jgi:hypothetical protein
MSFVTDAAIADRPWIALSTEQDVEMWIGQHNADLQQCIQKASATGYGVCFNLDHSGQILCTLPRTLSCLM